MMITGRFPIGTCPQCERDVLLARMLADDGALLYTCMHCETRPAGAPRFIGAQSLRGLGYAFDGDPEPEPFTGCGKENCGQGQCKHSSKRHPFKDPSP